MRWRCFFALVCTFLTYVSMFNPVFVIQAGETDWWKKRGTLIAYGDYCLLIIGG